MKMLCKFNFRVEIKFQVEEVSRKLELNPNRVFPVRNYSVETECDLHIDILNLRAQRQILRSSTVYLKDKNKVDRINLKELAKLETIDDILQKEIPEEEYERIKRAFGASSRVYHKNTFFQK